MSEHGDIQKTTVIAVTMTKLGVMMACTSADITHQVLCMVIAAGMVLGQALNVQNTTIQVALSKQGAQIRALFHLR